MRSRSRRGPKLGGLDGSVPGVVGRRCDTAGEAGPPTPADGTALTSTLRVPVKPARMTREPTFKPRRRLEVRTPEEGGAEHLKQRRSARFTLVRMSGARGVRSVLLLCWRDTGHPQGGGSEAYLERI